VTLWPAILGMALVRRALRYVPAAALTASWRCTCFRISPENGHNRPT